MQRTLFALVAAVAVVLGAVLFFVLRPQASGTPADAAVNPRHFIGPADAKVTVVDFSNYLCVHCQGHAADVLPRIKREYVDTGKVRYIFRDAAWAGQDMVVRASEAAACAADSGLYFQYHEVLFRSAQSWGGLSGESLDKYLADLAGQVGMAPATFSGCLASGKHRDAVLADRELAQRVGVTGTPTFFVNGVEYNGNLGYDKFKEILDKALAGEATTGSDSGQSTPQQP